MREDWKEIELGSLIEITSSKRIYLSDYVDTGIPFYRSKEIIESYKGQDISLELFITEDRYLKIKKQFGVPQINDILITSVGTIGIPYQVQNNKPFYFKDGNLIWLKFPKKELDISSDYLYFFIGSDYGKGKLDSILIGSSQKALTISGLKKIKFNLPPLQTQRKIASILSGYNDLIENNLMRIKLLEEKAQLTYEEWFVKMRFPGYETAVFDEVTGLPEGWEKVKLGELLEVTSSKRIFLSDYVEEGIPFYRGKEIILKSKNETINDLLYISKNKFEEIKKKYDLPKTGDILVTAVGTLGYPYLVTESDGDFYFKDGNLIWLKNSQLISSTYLISCFKNENFQSNLKNTAIGSSQKALTISSLKDILILNPKSEIQLDFDSLIIPLFNSIENLQNQNRLLIEARDILLPRLMSGMINVEEVQIGKLQTT